MSNYKTLAQRLAELTTRIDSNKYNEIQGKLYNNNINDPALDCDKLEDIPSKACRLITNCDVPEATICKVSQNFKTTIPPSHPPENMPLYIIADLLPCYLEGRTICPEFELWECWQGHCYPTSSTAPKAKVTLPFGDLWIQTSYKVWQSCCNECDKEYNYDYLRLDPGIATWLECSSDSNSYSYSASTSESASIYGYKLNASIGNNIKVNLCENKIEFEPEIALEVSCSDVIGDTYSDSASIALCDDTFITGSVAITPTLHCDGKIENEIDFKLELGAAGCNTPVGLLSSLGQDNGCLTVGIKRLIYSSGILCSTVDDQERVCIDNLIINIIRNNISLISRLIVDFIINGGGDDLLIQLRDAIIDCKFIKDKCGWCCSDSASSSSSTCPCMYSYGTPSGSMYLSASMASATDNILSGSVTSELNSKGIPINVTTEYYYDSYNQEYTFGFYVYGEENKCIDCVDPDIARNGITSITVTYTTINDGSVHTVVLPLDNPLTVTWKGTCPDCESSDSGSGSSSSTSSSSSSGDPDPDPEQCRIQLYDAGGTDTITRIIGSLPASWTNIDISPWTVIQDNLNGTITIGVPNNTAISMSDLGVECIPAGELIPISYMLVRGYYNGIYTTQKFNFLDSNVMLRVSGDCTTCEDPEFDPQECVITILGTSGNNIYRTISGPVDVFYTASYAPFKLDHIVLDEFDTTMGTATVYIPVGTQCRLADIGLQCIDSSEEHHYFSGMQLRDAGTGEVIPGSFTFDTPIEFSATTACNC